MSEIKRVWARLEARINAYLSHGRSYRLVVIFLSLLILGAAFGPSVARQVLSSEIFDKREHEPADLVRRRADWFFRPRATENGHVPYKLRLQALEQHDRMLRQQGTFVEHFAARLSTINPSLAQWTPLGPQPTTSAFFSNTSGRVNALAVDNCDATGNTVYLGGAEGGVWKTTDGGQHWLPLTDQQPSLATGSIALDPGCVNGHSAAIYVGTGESNFAVDNIYGAGVLKSIDGGATWTHDQTFTAATFGNAFASGPYIGDIAIDPSQSSTLVAAVVLFSANGFSGAFYRSVDSGVNWTGFGPGGVATSVVFDPNSPGTVYGAMGNPFGDFAHNGIFKSTDHGQTWTQLTTPVPVAALGRITLVVSTQGNPPTTALYAVVADGGSHDESLDLLGIFRSMDGGTTWTSLTTPNFCRPQCWYDMSFGIVPGGSGSVLFAGGAAQATGSQSQTVAPTLIRSTDGGNTWADISLDGSGTQLHVDHHAIAFTPSGNKVYVGNDGGVWSSVDAMNPVVAAGSQHWTNLNATLNITQFYPGNSIHPATDQVIYGGTQDNGTEQFNGSTVWGDTEACGDGGFTAIDQQTPSIIYASCDFFGPGTLNKNILNGVPGTNGINWVPIDIGNGIDFNDGAEFIPPFVIDSKISRNLYFGTFRMYQTMNAGDSWHIISSDLTQGFNGAFITAITVAPSDSNTVYAATSNGLVWKSSNALQNPTFQEIDSSIPLTFQRAVTSIAVDNQNPATAFVGYSGFNCSHLCGGGHIFLTTNSGAFWNSVDGNLPDIPVNDVVIDPTDATDNTVYVATDAGVFASSNATAGIGTLWTPVATGLPKVVVLSLKLRNASRTLVAGTHGRGVWSLLLPNLPAYNLSAMSPTSASSSSAMVQLTATGTGFTPQSAVNFNGNSLSPTAASATSLSATVPAADVVCNGGVPVFVADPVKGNSNTLTFSFFGGTCDFSFGMPSPSTNTVTAGFPAAYTLPINAIGAANGTPTALSCTSSPAEPTISCNFSQNPFTPGTDGASVTVTVNTVIHTGLTPAPAFRPAPPAVRGVWLILGAMFAFVVFACVLRTCGRRPVIVGMTCATLIVILGAMVACGGGSGGGGGGGRGGGGGGTPPGTYMITINGQAGNFNHSSQGMQLVVH